MTFLNDASFFTTYNTFRRNMCQFSQIFCRAVSFCLTGIDSRKYATVRKLLYSTGKSETI